MNTENGTNPLIQPPADLLTQLTNPTITFTAAGSNGDTITINGVVITLVTSGPTGNEILIGADASATATNLQAFLAASNDPALTIGNYTVSGAVVTIFCLPGKFTLAASSTAITLSESIVNAFPLQTTAWLKMQDVVTKGLAFPLSGADFEALYGTFSDEGSVETALSILGQINTTAAKYGDPQTLISSLPDFAQSHTPPSSIYGHAVWLAAQTQLAAQQIGSLLNEGLADIGQESDPTQRLQDLTALLTGEGMVNSYATKLQGYISGIAGTITFTAAGSNGDTITINGVVITLVTSGPTGNEILIGGSASATATNLQAFLAASADPALTVVNYTVSGAVVTIVYTKSGIAAGNSFTLATSSTAITLSGATLGPDTGFLGAVRDFYTELNLELTGQSNSLQWYLKKSSNVYTDAQNAVSGDEQQIAQLNDSIKKLNDEYIGFTVAGSVAPLLLLFPLVGIYLAIADAATFGVLATKVKRQLDDTRNSLNSATEDEQKKAALVTQLGGFNTVTGEIETDGQDFLNAISKLLSGWAEFSSQITTQLNALTPEDLANWSAFMEKVGFQTALDGWTTIENKAEQFFQAGFVQFSTDTSRWLSA